MASVDESILQLKVGCLTIKKERDGEKIAVSASIVIDLPEERPLEDLLDQLSGDLRAAALEIERWAAESRRDRARFG